MERKAFRAKKIVTMGEQGDVENGIMLTAGGKVEQVGAEGELEIPNSAERYDFTDKVLLPGFVDAHSHLGIHEDAEGWEGQDTNEMTDPVTPQLRGIDGLNPEDLGLQDAAVAGVTTVNTGPGSGNVIGGQFVAVKTGGASVVEDKVISEPTAMKMATGENPKRVYREKDSMPSTRTGTAAKLRQALFDAQNYRERKSEGEKGFKKDFGLESLLPVLKGELKAKIHAHRADDIVTAVRIAEEFGLSYSIEHCTEGHKVAQFLAERGAEAVAGPFFTSRSKRELMQRSFRTPGILSDAGVKVAITTDAPVVPIQYLPLMAGFCIREGMDERSALRAITIDSAEIAGVGDRVGSLEEGKDADFIVAEDLPLRVDSKVEEVYLEGEKIDLERLPHVDQPRTY